jgi:two-component system OmpR family response regulator
VAGFQEIGSKTGHRAAGAVARAVIVDDDDVLAGLLAEALHANGWEVARASDGLEAMGVIRLAQPDVVILDLDLPHVYGQVLLRTIKRDPDLRHIGVVIATGHPNLLDSDDRALTEAVLRKPFGIDHLVAAAQEALAAGSSRHGPRT